MSNVTRILEAVKNGDQGAGEELIPLTYAELRRIAQSMMENERAGHTLQPTALVHEAYLRLVGPGGETNDWDSRGHFFTAAAETMRRILVDHARRKLTLKRGSQWDRATWDEDIVLEVDTPADELIAIDEALAKFEKVNPEAAQVVKLRYFAGMTVEETAAALGLSKSSIHRTWRAARAWLFRDLKESDQ